MPLLIGAEVAALRLLTAADLRRRFAELFGEPTHATNKTWLIRRIAWRLQALAEGDLSERARHRAEELANDADLRMNPPRPRAADMPRAAEPVAAVAPLRDRRLPPVGSVLARLYRGQTVQVRVLADGFEYEGRVYASLSAVAQHITGTHCNGYLFFRLTAQGGSR